MARRICLKARKELVGAIGERYERGSREDKLYILDEFVAVTGYHRKHAIRMLNEAAEVKPPGRRSRSRVCGDTVQRVRVLLWYCPSWL